MKRLLGIAIVVAMSSMIVLGECSEGDKKMLEAFDRAWGAAGQAGDKAMLMAIYADDYMGLPDHENKTSTIDSTMKTFEKNKSNPNPNKTSHDIYRITCTPTSATITHRNVVWTANGTGGKPETFYTRSVHFLEKRDGKWQVVSNSGSGLDDFDTIWYLEQAWNDALWKGDKKWFEDNFASDFSSISGSTGALMNKTEELASIGKDKFDMVDTSDMNIRIEGNTAVITGVFHTKGTDDKGKAFDNRVRYTDTWVKRDGRWIALASQGTPMK